MRRTVTVAKCSTPVGITGTGTGEEHFYFHSRHGVLNADGHHWGGRRRDRATPVALSLRTSGSPWWLIDGHRYTLESTILLLGATNAQGLAAVLRSNVVAEARLKGVGLVVVVAAADAPARAESEFGTIITRQWI